MARFGRDFVRAATQPAYTQGLFTAARQLGEMPGLMRQEQERKQTQQSLANMMNTNTRIAETGNLKGLEDQRVLLTEMLSQAIDDQSRDMIIGELSRVEGLRDVAKPVANKRNIDTLLRAEKSLNEADQQLSLIHI